MENLVILVGFLGGPPELNYTAKGTPVAHFQIATNSKWSTDDGEKKKRTTWHRVEVWKKLAEACSKVLTKGSLVFVRGELENKEWSGEDGQIRYDKVIKAGVVKFLNVK